MQRQWLLIFILTMISFISNCQKKNDLSAEVTADYGFGKQFNNRAISISTRYNLFDYFRIAPSYSYFLKKDRIKMNAITLDFHYLFSDKNSNIIPYLKNQGVYYYPILGFNVINSNNAIQIINKSAYSYSFGFNCGIGVEYELPTLQNGFRDMAVNFEVLYVAVDKMYRPLLSFGLVYYFKIF